MKQVIYLSLAAILFMALPVNAQKRAGKKKMNKTENRAKILKKKLAYFNENLKLNKKEKKAFDEAYKQYAKKSMSLKETYKKEVLNVIRKDAEYELQEKEKQQIIDKKLKLDQSQFELNQEFIKKLRKILPSEKVIHYFKLERQFNRKLMKNLEKRRHKMQNRRHHKKQQNRIKQKAK